MKAPRIVMQQKFQTEYTTFMKLFWTESVMPMYIGQPSGWSPSSHKQCHTPSFRI
jgi:hypothetical protein